MMRQQDAVILGKAKYPNRQPSDRAGHAVAIQIERGQVRRADVLRNVHLHAIDNGQEILALETELANRGKVVPQSLGGIAPVQRVNIVPPFLERGQPFRPRALRIRDIVDLPAETVDLEHGAALLARQNAHGRVERTAGRSVAVIRVSRRRFSRHAPAAGVETGRRPINRRVISLARPPTLCVSNSTGPRWTRSLSGSRSLSSPTILSAKDWITEISSPRRRSFTPAHSDLLSSSKAPVRAASECRHCSSGADARAPASSSTDAPAAASASRGR